MRGGALRQLGPYALSVRLATYTSLFGAQLTQLLQASVDLSGEACLSSFNLDALTSSDIRGITHFSSFMGW